MLISTPFRAGFLGMLALLFGLSGLAACGGGSTGESGGDPFVADLPDETVDIPAAPPTGGGTPGTPPTEEPPADEPPVDVPPTEEPPTEEPPIDGPPSKEPPKDPPPGVDVPPPPEPLPVFRDVGLVLGIAVEPTGGIYFGIEHGSGRLLTWTAADPAPAVIGETGVTGATALAWIPSAGALYAATPREGGDVELHRIPTEPDQAAVLVGTVPGHARLDGLAWHAPANALFGIDAETDELLQIDHATATVTATVARLTLIGDAAALTSHAAENVLYAADGLTGDIVQIRPSTGSERRMATLAEGPVLALAFDEESRRFFGGAAVDPRILQVDPMGEWIDLGGVHGLAHDPATGILYGSHPGHAILVRIERESGWRQMLGYLGVSRLSSLAWDAEGGALWSVSETDSSLHRIDPATASAIRVGVVVDAAGEPVWQSLASLAKVRNALVAVEQTTGALVEIDTTTAEGTVIATLPPDSGIESLAFDAGQGRLHAFSNVRSEDLEVDVEAGWKVTSVYSVPNGKIAGMAWIDAEAVLIGTDRQADAVVEIHRTSEPPFPFDEIDALAYAYPAGRLIAFDLATTAIVNASPESPAAEEIGRIPAAQIQGLAYAPAPDDAFYGVDNVTGTLSRILPNGDAAVAGVPGALLGLTIHALAFDGQTETLWAVDDATKRLLTIDLDDAEAHDAFPALDPLPFQDIEAMAWDPDSGFLVAVERTTQQLIDIDPATGAAAAFALIEPTGVTGAAVMPETGELVVFDADTDRIVRLDRYTGATLEPWEALALHRGGPDDAMALPMWPQGAVRSDAWGTFAIEVYVSYQGDGTLSFRRGEETLYERTFDPTHVVTIEDIPEPVRTAARVGDTITWGLHITGHPEITAVFDVVDPEGGSKALASLEAIPSWADTRPSLRVLATARALSRQGLHTEALEALLAAPDLEVRKSHVYRVMAVTLLGLGLPDQRIDILVTAAANLRRNYAKRNDPK